MIGGSITLFVIAILMIVASLFFEKQEKKMRLEKDARRIRMDQRNELFDQGYSDQEIADKLGEGAAFIGLMRWSWESRKR